MRAGAWNSPSGRACRGCLGLSLGSGSGLLCWLGPSSCRPATFLFCRARPTTRPCCCPAATASARCGEAGGLAGGGTAHALVDRPSSALQPGVPHAPRLPRYRLPSLDQQGLTAVHVRSLPPACAVHGAAGRIPAEPLGRHAPKAASMTGPFPPGVSIQPGAPNPFPHSPTLRPPSTRLQRQPTAPSSARTARRSARPRTVRSWCSQTCSSRQAVVPGRQQCQACSQAGA